MGAADDSPLNDGTTGCYDPENSATGDDGDEHIDIGIAPPCETVAGVIFYDIGRDGCDDGVDSLVMQPVTVSLYSCGDIPGTDTPLATATVTDGTYEFGPGATADATVCLTARDSVFVVFDLGGTLSADGYTLSLIHI